MDNKTDRQNRYEDKEKFADKLISVFLYGLSVIAVLGFFHQETIIENNLNVLFIHYVIVLTITIVIFFISLMITSALYFDFANHSNDNEDFLKTPSGKRKQNTLRITNFIYKTLLLLCILLVSVSIIRQFM